MGVDGQPALLMKWDNGRGLNLLPLSVGLALRSKQLLQLAGSPFPIRPLCPPLEICRGRGAPSTAKFRPPQQMPIQSQEMRIVAWAENCYTKIVEKAHECRHLFSFAQGPPWPRAPAKISTTLFPCLRFRRGHTAALGRRPHTADQSMGKGSLLYENWFYWTRNYGKTHGKESD